LILPKVETLHTATVMEDISVPLKMIDGARRQKIDNNKN
jgi:hypothetical protein